jgi:hypothetical protein
MSLDLFNKIESVGRNAETYYEAEIKKDFPNYSMIIERFKKVITMRPSTLKEKKWIADSYFRLAICEVNKKEDGYIAYEALSYYQAAEQRYLSITTEIENLRKSQRSMDSPQLSALYYNLGICQCRIGILYIDIDNTANSTRMISMSTCNHEGYFKNAKEHFKAALKESNRELESQLALDARRSFEFKQYLRRKYCEFYIKSIN